MQIYYPPLVEQACRFFYGSSDVSVEMKTTIYKMLIEEKLLDENGNPTEYALKKGLILRREEVPDLSFDEFLELYPVFKRFPASNFRKIGGFWEIKTEFAIRILDEVQAGNFNLEEVELSNYFEDRLEEEDKCKFFKV
ncbi:hypothetical protein LZD79_07405 [Lactobacillus mulieris]|uniref:hypothetical protein n=1 Tax=Lactobacillus mulieris TaxID=2508708 RepID=UPI000A5C81AF|nr:hypothetical protein [Lactobacillus mulieris]MCF1797925.1 hypothetical protein [Lactobacillus mulieris]